jgi:hypothetical protein
MAFRDLFSIRKPADSLPADSPPPEIPLQKLEWESAKAAPVVVPQQTAPSPLPAGQGAAFAPLPEMGGDPLFQVFVLGTRSAGKTVLLSALYRLLCTQDPIGNNFRLLCKDFKSEKLLDDTFNRIADPSQDWPPGSTGIDQYIFDCVHCRAGRDINLFKFRYFDFPGGFVSDARTPEESQFIRTQVRAAHSILILLDGKKIKNAIENIAPATPKETSLYQDLDMLTRVAQDCIGKPMHFAITKYDILSPERHPLSLIKEKLLGHYGFNNIIEQQKRECPVHLLPVSAVGEKFASYDPANQLMKKLPNGQIKPSRVDLSLTFTIVDYLAMIAAERSKELSETTDDSTLRRWFIKKVNSVLSHSGTIAAPVLTAGFHTITAASLTNPFVLALVSGASMVGVKAVIDAGANRLGGIVKALAKETEEAQTKIRDEHSAAEAVLKIQLLIAQKFKAEFPDSSFS